MAEQRIKKLVLDGATYDLGAEFILDIASADTLGGVKIDGNGGLNIDNNTGLLTVLSKDGKSLEELVTSIKTVSDTVNKLDGAESTEGSIKKQIAALEKKILLGDATGEIAEAYDTIKEIADWIGSHGTEATNLAGALAALTTRVDTTEDEINTLQADVTGIKADYVTTATAEATYASKDTVSTGLAAKIDKNQGADNKGQYLRVDEDGNVGPASLDIPDQWNIHIGNPAVTPTETSDALYITSSSKA